MRSWWGFGEDSGSPGKEPLLALIKCAFCGERGQIAKLKGFKRTSESRHKTLNYDTIQCNNCGNYMFFFWSASNHFDVHAYQTLPWPLGEIEAPEHWSKDIKRYWLQAHKSLDGDNWDAAALMARSALQIVMRDQQATGRSLYEEIKDLHSKGVLPQIMKDFADEVRELGNDSAHPSPGAKETKQKDAEDIVEFLDIVLDYLYNLPKKINDYRARKITP